MHPRWLSSPVLLAVLGCTGRGGFAPLRADPGDAPPAADETGGEDPAPTAPGWIWRAGSQSTNLDPVLGTQGTPALGNHPGSRRGALGLRNATRELWLFGGAGANGVAQRADVWRYDLDTGEWTWLAGATGSDPAPDYATPRPGGKTGARGLRRNDGALLFVAGLHRVPAAADPWRATNATWRLEPTAGAFSLVSGRDHYDDGNPPTPGTTGVAAAANLIGARMNHAAWDDGSGRLWVFGGYGYANDGAPGNLNDLWRLEANEEWVFLAGPGTPNGGADFGTPGQPGGWPGSNYAAATTWVGNDGRLWLFGGSGASTTQFRADLWALDPAALEWSWMRGPATGDTAGVYGTLGVGADGNNPGARIDAAGWVGADGDLFLFGGTGLDADATRGQLNDLWRYDIATDQWVWVGGADRVDDPGTAGALGVPATDNWPGARSQCAAWSDGAGGAWLYGGDGPTGRRADLWTWRP